MAKTNYLQFIGIFLIATLLISVPGVVAQFSGGVGSSFSGENYQVIGSSSNPQFNQPSFYAGSDVNIRDYWSDFNETCKLCKNSCKQSHVVRLTACPNSIKIGD